MTNPLVPYPVDSPYTYRDMLEDALIAAGMREGAMVWDAEDTPEPGEPTKPYARLSQRVYIRPLENLGDAYDLALRTGMLLHCKPATRLHSASLNGYSFTLEYTEERRVELICVNIVRTAAAYGKRMREVAAQGGPLARPE